MAGYDVEALLRALRAEQSGDVTASPGAKALYAVDASNYRSVPEAVVVPRTEEDLVAALGVVRAAGAPLTLRGGGTSMAGNAIGGVVLDLSRHLNQVLDIDAAAATAVVQPGVVLTDLTAAAARHGLTFGADPSSASRATLGGMIANNACGAHSVAWGTTADNVRALDVVTGAGDRCRLEVPRAGATEALEQAGTMAGAAAELYRGMADIGAANELMIRRQFGGFSRQISGYALQHLLPGQVDLVRLLCGSEGTLATTTRATVALVRRPPAVVLLALGFADSGTAADSVPHLLRHDPLTVESINVSLVERLPADVRHAATAAGLPPGSVWLLVEVDGATTELAAARAESVATAVLDAGVSTTVSVVVPPSAQAVLWRCRRDGTGLATRRADGAEAWGGWEDAAVPPQRLGAYLRELDVLLSRYGYSGAAYGHFGEGCMHMRVDFDLLSEAGVRAYRAFVEEATDLVVSLGGSVSGEHGDGRARSALLSRMYGSAACDLFAEVKRAWDPDGGMNPHVVVDPAPLDTGVKHLGPAKDRRVAALFSYPADGGSFAAAQRRCVGVGKCRQSAGGVMCPSFQVTREEQHSTRGRAHLLWEMLEGDVVTGGWRSEEVRDALDLCLSCKGCLADCPVNVDMATYKAEFTHHHYKGRAWQRPRSHWSTGWLPLWARLAYRQPRIANAVIGSRAAPLLKRLGGIAAERALPTFATASLRDRLSDLPSPTDKASRGRVVLWPDTFTNYLTPEVGVAAVRVLRDAGFDPVLPSGPVCCGLTWVSTGQLTVARRVLRRSLKVLRADIEAGTPIVGLEPSCTAMLRHDAPGLVAADPLVHKAVGLVKTLGELLVGDGAMDWTPPQVGGAALVQVHCHQHAVLGFDADRQLMEAAGITADVPDSGCCGLAGNFGFEEGHAQLSQAVGERVILPAVRAAASDTAVVADGFSCRTQIAQGTGRRALHLAELLASGLPDEPR